MRFTTTSAQGCRLGSKRSNLSRHLIEARRFNPLFANEPKIDPATAPWTTSFWRLTFGRATHETRHALGWLLSHGIEVLDNGVRSAKIHYQRGTRYDRG